MFEKNLKTLNAYLNYKYRTDERKNQKNFDSAKNPRSDYG